jgi:hypothetical protein
MAPFITSGGGKLIFGLIAGFILGFTIQKAKVVRYEVLVGQLRLKDFTMVKLMLTAVVVGMVGIYFFKDIGIVGLSIKSTHLVANIVGGLIFGVGFALLGYCPGTGVGAIGEGRTDAFWGGVLGMVVGAALYAEVYHFLTGNLLSWGSYGKITIPSILRMGSPYHWIIVAVFCAGIILFLRFLEKRGL